MQGHLGLEDLRSIRYPLIGWPLDQGTEGNGVGLDQVMLLGCDCSPNVYDDCQYVEDSASVSSKVPAREWYISHGVA